MDLKKKYPLKIYNTLNKKKEEFKPITEGYLGMYVCGPTAYSDPHLGHARAAITFDVVHRYFKYLGYKVRYVRNITDVGHLEDEVEGTGEDRIAKKARLEKLEPMEVVQVYTRTYHKAVEQLNTIPPSIEPSASGHVIEQINVVKKILEHGLAYEVNGSVYFDVKKYMEEHNYGQLSGKVVDDLMSGSRELNAQDEKKNPYDFALWKKAKPEHIMKWDSPWGEGFPGWHIECTTMSAKYLGVPFDIHGGGLDLQFPHHESEIAQSFGAFEHTPANYWIHNNLLTIEGTKMSRSLGNFITLEELFSGNHKLLEQPYSPMTVRFFMLQAHYSSPVDFSNEALKAAEKGFNRLMNTVSTLKSLQYNEKENLDEPLDNEIVELLDSLNESMSDDFNTPRALASLFDLTVKINSFADGKLPLNSIKKETFQRLQSDFNIFIFDVLGLKEEKKEESDKLSDVVELLIQMRNDARKSKDFEQADKIRDELTKLGIQLKDSKDGNTTFSIN